MGGRRRGPGRRQDEDQARGKGEGPAAREGGAYDFTHQLTHTHRVDDATYARAVDIFGDTGLVDRVMLIGLYLTVSAIVNAFEIPLPEEAFEDGVR